MFIKALKGLEKLKSFDINWKFGQMKRIEGFLDCEEYTKYKDNYPDKELSGKFFNLLQTFL